MDALVQHERIDRQALQPHFSHSQTSQVQESPLQSGHLQPTHGQDVFVAAFRAEQQEPCAQLAVGAVVAAPQPQSLHAQTSQVHDWPLQSGHWQFSQPHDRTLGSSLLAMANIADARIKPKLTDRAATAYFIFASSLSSLLAIRANDDC